MRTNKQYFFYCVKDDILIFDVFDYLEELAADTVDYFFDWNLVKDNKVSLKNTIFKEFVNQRVSFDIKMINTKAQKLNCSVLCYVKDKKEYNQWSSFFEDSEKVVKMLKRILKKNLPSFFLIEDGLDLFKTINGTFKNIPTVSLSGEDEEFLNKNLKKLKK